MLQLFQTLGVVSDVKMNLVGALVDFFNFSIVYKSAGKNQKKLRKNGNFYEKPVFDQIDFYIVVIQKLITVNT
ncbi:hypothetical protein FWK35_00016078 [Aphis craccivora]|uniref:Uncharacterized protein n=1 Tax=Aphis craccivora TaxID=307492 RepID=A0A6G0ZAU0_APHCR|nr:hypothetical protein FWK35_00016078 [Aphis craccivora]